MKFSVLSKWFNAALEAWNRGEAPWVFDEHGHSRIVRFWELSRRDGDNPDLATVAWIQMHGIDIRRKKVVDP